MKAKAFTVDDRALRIYRARFQSTGSVACGFLVAAAPLMLAILYGAVIAPLIGMMSFYDLPTVWQCALILVAVAILGGVAVSVPMWLKTYHHLVAASNQASPQQVAHLRTLASNFEMSQIGCHKVRRVLAKGERITQYEYREIALPFFVPGAVDKVCIEPGHFGVGQEDVTLVSVC